MELDMGLSLLLYTWLTWSSKHVSDNAPELCELIYFRYSEKGEI